jgi:TIR domain
MAKSNQVSISYSHQDREWVREFVEKLTKEGVDAWLDEKEIDVGEFIADKLEQDLRSSDSLVLVLSAENIHSSNLFFELGAALGAGKKVIAIVDENVQVKDLPLPIRRRRYLLRESPEETARSVVEALATVH